MAKRAVFIDRDGTLNEECSYLYRVEDCRFIPGSAEAVSLLNAAGFPVIVVTNQSGIARGYFTETDLLTLHDYMAAQLQDVGATIDGWYYCPHHPEHPTAVDDCSCRKPLPGMLLKAAAEMNVDLASSWMIGDKKADIDAGNAAGCRSILVLTGYGAAEQATLPAGRTVCICEDLYAAVRHILATETEELQLCR